MLGEGPATSAEQLGHIGFVAQNTPVYENLSIETHLSMGAALNPKLGRAAGPVGECTTSAWIRVNMPANSPGDSARSSP